MSTYDYTNQAWITDGKYVRCNHPETMECGCYGRAHAGEPAEPFDNSAPPIAMPCEYCDSIEGMTGTRNCPIHAAAPPITGEADAEYRTRIDAERVTWQFTDKIRPKKPQAAIEDLPLFGGERQEEMF